MFPDLIWEKPETRSRAGKLLIIGGNLHGFSAPGAAYKAANNAGIGTIRILLPDSTKKFLGRNLPEADYVPSTQSGSFSKKAIAQVLENSAWADGVILAGDFGRNSETAILLEKIINEFQGQLTLAGDSLDYFLENSRELLNRDNSLLTLNLGKLQKLAKHSRPGTPILNKMNLNEFVTVLADWTNGTPVSLITKHLDNILIASGGKVSSTPYDEDILWQTELAAYASVWWLQQPTKPFESITTAIFEYQK